MKFSAVLAGLILAGIPQQCLAQCGTKVQVATALPAQVGFAATFFPVAVLQLPQYGVGYSASYMSSQYDERIQRAEARIRELEALIAGQRPAVIQPAAVAVNPGVKVLLARCAACHDEQTAAKGKGLVLTAGGKFVGDERILGKVISQVILAKMPKGGSAIPDNEIADLVKWVDSRNVTVEAVPPPKNE